MKKVLLGIVLVAILLAALALIVFPGTEERYDGDRPVVVVTSFIGYDFVRQIAGDNVNLTNLLSPGVEMHSYEPSASDLIRIQNADLFIYIGGDMERWTRKSARYT